MNRIFNINEMFCSCASTYVGICTDLFLSEFVCSFQFTSLQKEIDDHKEEIKKYQAEKLKLEGIIRNLEKDIQGLKKEIQERDDTIQDKVSKMHELLKQWMYMKCECVCLQSQAKNVSLTMIYKNTVSNL